MKVLDKLREIDLGKIPGDQLLVPIDRKFLEWQSSRPESDTTIGITEDNQMIKTYLKVKNIDKLGPDTKIPLGLLILCYNMYLPKDRLPRLQDLQELQGMPIHSRLPFGVLLGSDVREAVLEFPAFDVRSAILKSSG